MAIRTPRFGFSRFCHSLLSFLVPFSSKGVSVQLEAFHSSLRFPNKNPPCKKPTKFFSPPNEKAPGESSEENMAFQLAPTWFMRDEDLEELQKTNAITSPRAPTNGSALGSGATYRRAQTEITPGCAMSPESPKRMVWDLLVTGKEINGRTEMTRLFFGVWVVFCLIL